MKQTIKILLGVTMLTAVSALPLAAQDFGFTIVNGTGGTITKITIQPSRKLYGTDKDDIVVYPLAIQDQQEDFIALPKRFRGFQEFDIALKYSGKNAETKDAVALAGGNNRFVAYPAGKSPTVPLAAAGAAATAVGVGVAVIGTTVATVAVPVAVSFSAVATGVVGSTLVVCPPLGIVLGAAAGVGFVTYQAVNHFTPDTLVMARDN